MCRSLGEGRVKALVYPFLWKCPLPRFFPRCHPRRQMVSVGRKWGPDPGSWASPLDLGTTGRSLPLSLLKLCTRRQGSWRGERGAGLGPWTLLCCLCLGLPSPYSWLLMLESPSLMCVEGAGKGQVKEWTDMRRGCGQKTHKSQHQNQLALLSWAPNTPPGSTAPAIGQGCRLTIHIVPPSQPFPAKSSQ